MIYRSYAYRCQVQLILQITFSFSFRKHMKHRNEAVWLFFLTLFLFFMLRAEASLCMPAAYWSVINVKQACFCSAMDGWPGDM